MLSDERTTHATSCRRRARSRVSSSRRAAPSCAPLVGFLRGRGHQRPHRRPTPTARSRRRCCTRPTSCSSTTACRPSGGIDLVPAAEGQRPHALRPDDPLHAQRSAAVPGARARGRRRRGVRAVDRRRRSGGHALWALLRTRALYRRIDRLQRTQRSEIVERRQWLSHFLHDLKGQVGALAANVDYLATLRARRRRPAARRLRRRASTTRAASSSSSRRPSARCSTTTASRPASSCRATTRFRLGEAAAEPIETLRRLADDGRSATLTVAARRPSASAPLYGDRELIASRDPEPGDGGAAPRRPRTASWRSRSPRPTRACASASPRRARRCSRASASTSSRRTAATPPARRCTASAWRWRARSIELSRGHALGRGPADGRLRVRVRAGHGKRTRRAARRAARTRRVAGARWSRREQP